MSRQSWILDFQRWQRRHLFASWSPVLQGRLPTASSTRLDQCTLIFVCFVFSFYLMWLYDSLGGIRLCLWRRPGWLLLHNRKKKKLKLKHSLFDFSLYSSKCSPLSFTCLTSRLPWALLEELLWSSRTAPCLSSGFLLNWKMWSSKRKA